MDCTLLVDYPDPAKISVGEPLSRKISQFISHLINTNIVDFHSGGKCEFGRYLRLFNYELLVPSAELDVLTFPNELLIPKLRMTYSGSAGIIL